MSAKNQDNENRWRNKVIAFRMSPEEAEMLDNMAKISGLTKQDYIVSKLLDHSVTVQGNPRVYKALRDSLKEVLSELANLQSSPPSADLITTINHITTVLDGLKGE